MPSVMKPNKPECFEGKRDRLAVETWLYQVGQYLTLIQVGNADLVLDDATKINFASMFLKGTAASWWYVKVQTQQLPTTWIDFQTAVRTEFIPQDSLRRARDKLRKLEQRTSVSGYLTEFRNIVLAIPGISEEERLDKFVSGLKPTVRLEVLKTNPSTFDAAAQVALNVDSALFGAGMFNSWGGQSSNSGSSGPQPMEIGNFEQQQPSYRRGSFRGNRNNGNFNHRQSEQRMKDMKNNACFVCHRPGCRPWKHNDVDQKRKGTEKTKRVTWNNTQVQIGSDTDSGNE